MKIAIIGASGWIGSTISQEAIAQGHNVISIGRHQPQGTDSRQLDLNNPVNLHNAVAGADVVIAAIGGRAQGNHEIVRNTAELLLRELPKAGIKRLLWVGGAGSLEISPGISLLSLPSFPEEYKAEAIAQGEALAVFRASQSPLHWTFISPAAQIFPGEKTGHYRVGGDQLLTDANGDSKISVQDYAKALVDETLAAKYPNQRIGVAY